MFTRLLDRFRNRTGEDSSPPGVSGTGAQPDRADAPPVLAGAQPALAMARPDRAEGQQTASQTPTEGPGTSLSGSLKDRILDRSRWLGEYPGCEERDQDSGVLLDALAASDGAVIRQPPVAARRLLTQARRQRTSYARMAETIESDPSLVQSLLKHANSAFYATSGGGGPIVSLPPALQRLGTQGIEIVVMAHLVEGTLCRPGGGLNEMAGMVWSHMVRTAPLSRALAPFFKADRDEAYSLGLLHDVGKLVIFNRIADLRKRLRRPVRFPEGWVKAVLRELHAPLGALAILEWGMGERAALAIAHHHRSPPPEFELPGSEVVFLAERLDLVAESGETPSFEAIWAAGALTGDLEAVQSRCA